MVVEVAARLLALCFYIVAARQVGPSAVGAVAVGYGVGTLCFLLPGSGTDSIVAREVARTPHLAVRLSSSALIIKSTGMVGGLILAPFVISTTLDDRDQRLSAACFAIAILFDAYARTPQAVLYAEGRVGAISTGVMLQRAAPAVAGCFILNAGLGMAWAGLAAIVGSSATLGLLGLSAFRHRERFSTTIVDIRYLLSKSMPVGLMNAFGLVLARVDVILIGIFLGAHSAGLYGISYKIIESSFVLSWTLGAFLLPSLVRAHDPGELFRRILKLELLILAPGAAVLWYSAPLLVTELFGEDFESSSNALRILSPVVVLYAACALAAQVLISEDRQRRLTIAVGTCTALNLLLNLALIEPLGMNGSAWAMTLSQTVLVGLLVVALRSLLSGQLGRLLIPALLSASTVLILGLALPMSWTSVGLLLLVGAGVAAGSERVLYPRDFSDLVSLVRARPS